MALRRNSDGFPGDLMTPLALFGLLLVGSILVYAWIDTASLKSPPRGYVPGGYQTSGPDAGTIVAVVV